MTEFREEEFSLYGDDTWGESDDELLASEIDSLHEVCATCGFPFIEGENEIAALANYVDDDSFVFCGYECRSCAGDGPLCQECGESALDVSFKVLSDDGGICDHCWYENKRGNVCPTCGGWKQAGHVMCAECGDESWRDVMQWDSEMRLAGFEDSSSAADDGEAGGDSSDEDLCARCGVAVDLEGRSVSEVLCESCIPDAIAEHYATEADEDEAECVQCGNRLPLVFLDQEMLCGDCDPEGDRDDDTEECSECGEPVDTTEGQWWWSGKCYNCAPDSQDD